jgi:tetratricopeptide (TPR) repeat protein
MNAQVDDDTSAIPKRRVAIRAASLMLCLGVAWAAAVMAKNSATKHDVAERTPASEAARKTPEQILDGLPVGTSNSQTDQAITEAIQRVRIKPLEAGLWVNLGDALAQKLRDTANQNYYLHAETAYQRALELDSKNVDALTGMAWVTGGRHGFDQSIQWANKAIAIEPGAVAAHGIIGDAALEIGDYDQAYDQYQVMMDLRPDLSSWSRGAHLLWLTGDKTKAVWLMDKAIKSGAPFAENSAWCRAKLAMMHFNDGALLLAEQVLEPALKGSSHNTHVLLAAGKIAAARQDITAAIKFNQTVLEGGPNHEALVALGDLHAANGELELAEEFYVKVEALHAAHLTGGVHDHMQMARFYADHDRNLVEALRLAEQHKLTRNVIEADGLAWVYFKNGDQVHAIESIKLALSQGTPDPEIHYHAGLIAEAAGDLLSARKHLIQALELNPHFNLIQAPIAEKMLEGLTSPKSTDAAAAMPIFTKP